MQSKFVILEHTLHLYKNVEQEGKIIYESN